MRYAWNQDKASSNHQKHGVRFSDAVAVFEDERALALEDAYAEEERYVSIGMDGFGRVLVVAYTWRGEDMIRLISARKATRTERNQYAQAEP